MARLRPHAFGLRGRIAGAVLITAVTTLVVAGLVVLPKLETSLRNASEATLKKDAKSTSATQQIKRISRIPYALIEEQSVLSPKSRQYDAAVDAAKALAAAEAALRDRLGASNVTLFGFVDQSGTGRAIVPRVGPDAGGEAEPPGGPFGGIATAFHTGRNVYGFDNQAVRAAIPVPGPHADAVLAVYKSIDEIPAAVHAVRQALEIAAGAGLLLTLLLAIPLSDRLVRRLRRLRQAALSLATEGTAAAELPVDRARDEVGDLARSLATMQSRLRHQEEARRAFVATASHELRTPLASLDGMLELLDEDLTDDALDLDDAKALLERARAQSRRLGRLAADLLDLSRIDADVQLRSEPVELCELSRAVLAEFYLVMRDRDVSPELGDRCSPLWALADPGSVARILRILLDNALRVAPRGSEVSVTLTVEPRPSITVRDRGPGVAPQERELIFERFKRGRDTGGEAGFGLGLAIGRELAARMGGELVLLEDEPGAEPPGAAFRLSLPGARAPLPEPVTSAAAA